MNSLKHIIIIFLLIGFCVPGFSQIQKAKVYEKKIEMTTYPFGNPDPVANIGRIYPYFKFDGYTDRAQKRTWNFIILENQYIKVYITPEIGGKIWGAIEKSSGRDFIYFNRVVKFRNIAMRGPWTSGGIEFNFGAIGHAPSCSTPVDYTYRKEADGSVSCTVGAMDLASRSEWRVTIRLPRDTAFFETSCFWYNPTPFNHSFYHWMNAAAEVSGDLQYIFPGSHYLSHGGKASTWPLDNRGRDLSRYGNNTFGPHKSYHVMGTHNHFFAGYWPSKEFGFGHWALHGDKPGKKIWLWALSRQGEIWKDLLTDKQNKQYTEIQSGAMYTQANEKSTQTPFKHPFFPPHTNYQSTELWFPIKGTSGVTTVSPACALNIEDKNDAVQIKICSLQNINDELLVKEAGKVVIQRHLRLKPLEVIKIKMPDVKNIADLSINLGRGKLIFSANEKKERTLKRPFKKPGKYNWSSAEGLFVKGEEMARQRDYNGALNALKKCLTREPFHARALCRVGELYLRRGEQQKALSHLKQALAVNTYDAQANFYYAVANQDMDRNHEALAAFGWAARSPEFSSAAYYRMAMIYLKMGKFNMADSYGQRSLNFNRFSLSSFQLLAVSARLQQRKERAEKLLNKIREIDPLSHFYHFERYQWHPTDKNKLFFLNGIKNEFPGQTLLELALFYSDAGQAKTALYVLTMAPAGPVIHLWQAYLNRQAAPEKANQFLDRALKGLIRLNFPFRNETLPVLKWALVKKPHWKSKYYLALILWNNGRLSQAGELLRECGSEPEEYPFYLARGKLLSQLPGVEPYAVSTDYIKARTLSPKDWRCWHHLGQHYLKTSQPGKALAVLQKALARFKKNYIIHLDLAGALLVRGRFQKCLNLLKGTRVLPYEGAREGRNLYYQANILLAIQRLKQKNRAKVLYSCQQARLWPENLGVGKPYDADERMEDFITAKVYQLKGDQKLSNQHYLKVIEFTKKQLHQSSPYHYLAVLALKHLEKENEASVLLKSWQHKFPNDKIAQWCQAHFNGKHFLPPKITPPSREFTLLLRLIK